MQHHYGARALSGYHLWISYFDQGGTLHADFNQSALPFKNRSLFSMRHSKYTHALAALHRPATKRPASVSSRYANTPPSALDVDHSGSLDIDHLSFYFQNTAYSKVMRPYVVDRRVASSHWLQHTAELAQNQQHHIWISPVDLLYLITLLSPSSTRFVGAGARLKSQCFSFVIQRSYTSLAALCTDD